MDEPTLAQKLAAEVIGTAFLVFIGVGSVPATLMVNGDAPFTMADLGMISLAFGTIVVATVYALGHISGNHINPAVTIGLAVTGKFPWTRVPAYLGAQVVGAVVGAGAIIAVLGKRASDLGLGVASYSEPVGAGQAFAAEFVGTFILVFTIFGVIHRKAAAGFAGVAIGLVVFAAIIPVAPATGASINPARTFGPMLVQQIAGGTVQWAQLPVYVGAELLAGAVAALAYVAISRTTADRLLAAATPEPATPTVTIEPTAGSNVPVPPAADAAAVGARTTTGTNSGQHAQDTRSYR
jgi:glycerol uptake facilitator protein